MHQFDGTYVGEWFRDMVVRRPQGRPRIIPLQHAGKPAPASASYNLRAVVDCSYSDAFPLLRRWRAAHEAYFSEAAE